MMKKPKILSALMVLGLSAFPSWPGTGYGGRGRSDPDH